MLKTVSRYAEFDGDVLGARIRISPSSTLWKNKNIGIADVVKLVWLRSPVFHTWTVAFFRHAVGWQTAALGRFPVSRPVLEVVFVDGPRI